MSKLQTIGEIYDALEDADSEKFLGGSEIKNAAYTYQKVIERYVPGKSMDNVIAVVSQYGIACNKAGFEEGFKTAWNLIQEVSSKD